MDHDVPDRFVHRGFNLYLGTEERQNCFLVECLLPSLDQSGLGASTHVWFERFDARGPHLFLLLSSSDDAGSLPSAEWLERFVSYLGALSPTELPDRQEIEARHEGCRGKALCTVDREPGFEAEASCRPFVQPDDGYPFFLLRPEALASFWPLAGRQTRWALERLRERSPRPATAAAIRWLALLGRELRSRHPNPEAYWEYHASTLMSGLPARLDEDREALYGKLPGLIGDKNRDIFRRIWQETVDAEPPWPGFGELVSQALVAVAPGYSSWQLLREVVHTSLKQLGVPPALQIPLLFFAWLRDLELAGQLPGPDGVGETR